MIDLMRKGVGPHWRAARLILGRNLPQPCPYCGEDVLPTDDWDIDHRTPYAMGGSHALTNLRAAHRLCNRRAGLALMGRLAHTRTRDAPPSREW
jgi:5-methylcytosine-specific restriction endonuclease McrA